MKKEFIDFASLSSGVSLLKFYAGWCQPCKVLGGVIDSIVSGGEFSSISFYDVDVDLFPDICMDLDISSVPTLLIVSGGQVLYRSTGVVMKGKLVSELEKYM